MGDVNLMRRSRVLNKWRSSQPARMCALGQFLPPFIRLAAHNQYDCIWLDLEHRAMDQREIQALLAFFHLADIDCLLRPPTLEKTRLYRYLEDGATGLMIPHVSTPEKARQLVQSVKFPPLGDRGMDGAGLDSDFTLQGGADYPAKSNAETFLVVQIETLEAVENAEQIAAVPGVDALFVGPGDLGLRIRETPQAGMTMERAVERVATACRKHGKQWGQPAFNPEHLRQLTEQGARLANYGGDFGAIMTMLKKWGDEISQVFQDGHSQSPPASSTHIP